MVGYYVITRYIMLLRQHFVCYLRYAGFPKLLGILSSYLELKI